MANMLRISVNNISNEEKLDEITSRNVAYLLKTVKGVRSIIFIDKGLKNINLDEKSYTYLL